MGLTPAQIVTVRRAQGSRLRAARQVLGLTQVELCRRLNISQSSLSTLEHQRYQHVTVERARKFAEFFDCAIEDLFPAHEAVAS